MSGRQMVHSGSDGAPVPPLDFPAERVSHLLNELFRIVIAYLSELRTDALDSAKDHQREARDRLIEWYGHGNAVLKETA
eukprot:CAMPEP_0172405784 /NCGR_PEP_ID=MMETSP1061-20121228/68205_1 /TAXON_ID=37318 /ORGANISM="Pseudo-nitzschia pungens, Strain cf. pungens" /LENGTH=78 /DNA_ID=CAMNT_0013141113 /DNA_START=48 /DNA_END=280 /DNA_ORIENTATION=+